MKSLMTQFVIVGLLLAIMMVSTPPSFANGPAGVSNTLHNLSSSAPDDPYFPGQSFYRSNEEEVCVFCHTPHGGTLTGPLWNHTEPTNLFTHYNSATLSTYMKGLNINRPPNDESIICLSCHDGSISVYSLHNTTNATGQPFNVNTGESEVNIAWLFGGGSNIGGGTVGASPTPGGDLTNDHPISFSYDAVLGSPDYLSGGAKFDYLHDVSLVEGAGIKLYGVTHRVECSSCHDPHVDYMANTQYTPFLIVSNAGSALCLGCHNK